jgi:hypothetical protein
MVIRQVAGYWTTEDGERIELEYVITYSESDLLGSACVGRRAFSATSHLTRAVVAIDSPRADDGETVRHPIPD